MVKKMLMYLSICLLTVSFAQAQTGTVTGKIVDSNDETLIGANVVVQGTTIGTITDVNGNYTLQNVPTGETTLVASFIGFNDEEAVVTVNANQTTTHNFKLIENITSLDELVVIGYGTVKKEDATGSVTAINTEDFAQGAISTPDQLITGKVAGVQITSGGGAPGTGQTIRIRGGASIRASNDPLFVIDGVPVDGGGIDGLANPLSTINPNDIETMTVLKDASATAIYGSRASNGVIIITTKKSKQGADLTVNYQGKVSMYQIPKYNDVLSAAKFTDAVTNYANKMFADDPTTVTSLLGAANTDWQKEVFQNAIGTDHNISVAGAYDILPYRLSVGYYGQDGTLKTGSIDRTSVNLALNPTFFDDHLKVNLNAKGAMVGNQFADEGAIGAAVQMDPTKPVYNDDGSLFYWAQENGDPVTQATKNPVAMLDLREDISDVQRFTGNVQLDYKFHMLPELKANLNLGFDGSKSEGTVTEDATASWQQRDAKGNGLFREYTQEKKNKLLDFYLKYDKELSSIDSRFDIMGGYSYQSFWTESYSYERTITNNADGYQDTLSFPNYNPTENLLISFFGRANYTFKERYMITATLRDDRSSRFSEDNRSGLFPSAAFAWSIHKEPWMQNITALTQLKFRAGYGVTGQQDITDNDYPYQANYALSTPTASYLFGNSYYRAYRAAGYDEGIKWEETETYNVGLDFGLFNERIYGSVDAYMKKTTDLINFVPIPAGSNLSNYLLTNVGDMENKGLEFNIVGRPVSTPDLFWEVGFNATFNQNEITKLTAYDDPSYLGVETGGISGGVGNNIQIHSVGHPISSFFVFEQVYDNDGNPIEGMYVDRNEDGEITDADKYRYKDPNANLYFGINSRVDYKQWSFSFSGRAQFNNYVYHNVSSNDGELSRFYRPEGPYIANVHSSALDVMFYSPQYFSDYYIKNGSFFRMDDMTLSYLFENVINDDINISLSATVNNAFVITKYDGLDPEVSDGIDNNIYPRPRVFMFGVNVQF